jgi:IS30 family transposase
MTKHLTPDEQSQIIAMYHRGEKHIVIAATFGVTGSTITRVIKRAGIPFRWYRNCGRLAAQRAAE